MQQLIRLLAILFIIFSCSSSIENEDSVRAYLNTEYSKLLGREQKAVIEIQEQVARIGNRPEDLEVVAKAEKIAENATKLLEKIESSQYPNSYVGAIKEFQLTCTTLECEYSYSVLDTENISDRTQAKYIVLRLTQHALECLKSWVATTS